MAIGIDFFSDVSISVSPSGVPLGDFGTLAFLTTETGITRSTRAKSYGKISEVVGDWAVTTDVYKAALAFYSQTPTPKTFVVIYSSREVGHIETCTQALADAVDKGFKFVAVAVHKTLRDKLSGDGNKTTDIGTWCEANNTIFINTTNNVVAKATYTSSSPDVASLLKRMSLRFTMSIYSSDDDEYPCCSVFGRAATVNFEGVGTTITLNLKQMPTISQETLKTSELKNLRDRNCSAVISIGLHAAGLTNSRMANGSWLDTTHGLLWLENRIEVDMFNLLYRSNTKIPYSQVGINMAKSVLQKSLEAGVRNGFIAPGTISDGTYLPTGFSIGAITLADTNASDKSNRLYRGLSFKVNGAGALHEVSITGEFSE